MEMVNPCPAFFANAATVRAAPSRRTGGAMPPTQRRVLSSVALVLLTVLWGRSAGAQTTERVSVASGGTTEGNATSLGSALSADGRFVAFHSTATNLVAGDANGKTDVFVHDRQTGMTERVSVASGGTRGNNASSYPALSADGRFVAFDSDATDLVAGDTNGTTDVFVHDRQTGTTERVSVTSGGTQGNDSSAAPALSAEGGFVAFHSVSTNLVAGDTNGTYDVFVHDRPVSTTTTSTTQPATTSTTSTSTTTPP